MRKILVAGGAGYIGSHVCKALAAAAWRAQHSDLATIVQSAWRWHRGQAAAPARKIAVG